ncbi:class I SAM-dependent methyltransferase [Microbacterium foliorum]|uniref:Trans-aconitate 2-methyltransferase n=1 Tax=Microbacterium foliorum TaxID=104336 RepID=A0A0F0KXK0_9MICO|nr:daptide-type RiPP biosynthesis methyltransferase [Microbacterium foliorum]AXL13486.1 class I SAM-dependent methyltransferase [Microbacterium foliorum]KJL25637.1 Trans-aconitate 2-methyltransferase [Microbacterium foliorum]
MTGGITESVKSRLAVLNATPSPQDLYAGAGADFYERLVGGDRSEVREVLALARDTEGNVLDIAAGSGRLTIPLVRCGKRVTAIDLSPDMLALLQRALPANPLLECVVADMRTFALGRLYDLIVIGATSITLLDRVGRQALYARVRSHLSDGGTFALTIAGSTGGRALSNTEDQIVTVEGVDGQEDYLYSQQVIEGGAARVVNWVRESALTIDATVTILTSRLRILTEEMLSAELVEAGFTEPAVRPVRAHAGADILLLQTSSRGQVTPR